MFESETEIKVIQKKKSRKCYDTVTAQRGKPKASNIPGQPRGRVGKVRVRERAWRGDTWQRLKVNEVFGRVGVDPTRKS